MFVSVSIWKTSESGKRRKEMASKSAKSALALRMGNLLGRLERLLQLADAASHGELFAVVENNDVFAFHHRLKLLNAVDVHYARTAHAHKLFGRKLFFQRAHRLAEQ